MFGRVCGPQKLRIQPGSQPAVKKQTVKKQTAKKQTAKKQTAKKQTAKKQTAKKQTVVEPCRLHTVQHCGKTFFPVQFLVKICLRA
ncbi:hypothetical protein N7489_011662 [Penicillium chrysogenum]|uniref:uncharacterized protein n=1 Tax=Penicillium chrysogenum TaxID=5076 RepID=UPI0024DF26CB|nr:uncharacterized protein N7489_011662 [Penicillium chrysogenum]KAJ5230954.1 hypothetical protein N7489_011662 [Penicillium chrysogenum]